MPNELALFVKEVDSEAVEEVLPEVRAVPDEDAVEVEWLAEIDFPAGINLQCGMRCGLGKE